MATIKAAIALYDGVTSPLRNITQAMNVVINSFETMQRASSKSVDVAAIQKGRELLAQAEASFGAIENEIHKANQAQQKFNASLQGGSGNADGLLDTVKKIAATLGTAFGIKKAIGLSDDLTLTVARLNMINDGLQSTAELQNMIYLSAQQSRASFIDTAQVVSRLGLLAGKAFSSNKELVAFAELMNKQFKLGGASIQEQTAAMYQLTQAMASGRLQGDEFRSIMENAPLLAKAIEAYMRDAGVKGTLKDWAAEGLLTADVIKNAMFSVAGKTNEKFADLPTTLGELWSSIQNNALRAFQPVLNRMNEIANSEQFQKRMNSLIGVISKLGIVALQVFNFIAWAAQAIANNWSIVGPIIMGVVSAYLLLKTVTAVYNSITAVQIFLEKLSTANKALKAKQTLIEAAATTTATGAQVGLNAALFACPIVWIIGAIILLIVVIYAVIGAINKFAGTSISATGVIFGIFALLGANLINTFVVPVWNKIAALANFFGNVFKDPVAAVKVLFYDMVQVVLGFILTLARGIETLLNKIPGIQVNITSSLDSLYKNIEEASQKVKDESGWVEYVKKMEYIEYSDAWQTGYNFGQGIEDKISGIFDMENLEGVKDWENYLDGIYNNGAYTAENTAAMADSMEISQEELKYLRDLAEREAVNRFTTAELRVNFSSDIKAANSELDLDGVVTYLEDRLYETMVSVAEGVYD